jgi:2-phosphosulfolactate phosphatase
MFTQHPYRVRLGWGRRGAREAAERGDVLVIVDTLSFSSAVVTAVHHGVAVYPCAEGEDPAVLAERAGADVAVRRAEVPAKGRFSLSPLTYIGVEAGARIVLSSPNGATCTRYASQSRELFVGCLLNATAVAAAASRILEEMDASVTVVACGERWIDPSEDGPLRVAIEDFLGAGAIVARLAQEKSPEARVCEAAFLGARGDLAELIWDCGSGRQLRECGFGDDVCHAARLDIYDTVPVMRGERMEAYAAIDDTAAGVQ